MDVLLVANLSLMASKDYAHKLTHIYNDNNKYLSHLILESCNVHLVVYNEDEHWMTCLSSYSINTSVNMNETPSCKKSLSLS